MLDSLLVWRSIHPSVEAPPILQCPLLTRQLTFVLQPPKSRSRRNSRLGQPFPFSQVSILSICPLFHVSMHHRHKHFHFSSLASERRLLPHKKRKQHHLILCPSMASKSLPSRANSYQHPCTQPSLDKQQTRRTFLG